MFEIALKLNKSEQMFETDVRKKRIRAVRKVVQMSAIVTSRPAVPSVRKASHQRGLSQRGRRARTIIVLALLMAIAGQLFTWQSGQDHLSGQSAAANSQAAKVAIHYISVRAGETLWALAGRYAPNQDAQTWIDQVVQVNNLNSGILSAGQTLAIPNN